MAQSFKAHDGKIVKEGEESTIVLKKGNREVAVSGKVRSFEQDGQTRWEVQTGDPQWPAVGFLAENVLRKEG